MIQHELLLPGAVLDVSDPRWTPHHTPEHLESIRPKRHTPRRIDDERIYNRSQALTHPPIPVRILTCMCDNAINKHHNPDYGGLPGTMDISNTVNVQCIRESPTEYDDFIQSIRDLVQYTLVWERKHPDIPAKFKKNSDYHINARYFSEYTPTERAKPEAEDSARILIVPASFHHSLDHGPYHNMTSAEFTSDGVDPDTNENSSEKKPNLIPINHMHNSSPRLFAEASASGWQHHTVFVYVVERA